MMTLAELKTAYSASQSVQSTIKAPIVWRNKKTKAITYTMNVGDRVEVFFSEAMPTRLVLVAPSYYGTMSVICAVKHLTGFQRVPSMRALRSMMDSGIARTITGAKVEPDGMGSDGAPSWLMALGFI